MIDIVCLKWGNKFGPEYVNNLYSSIQRNTTTPFRFHCFTEDSTDLLPDVIIQELPELGVDGWWNKIYLFNDKLPFEIGAPIMFIDLDTLITGNIDHIINYNLKTMIGLENFYRGTFASGLLMWRHGAMSLAWDTFARDPQLQINQTTDGDQEYTAKFLPTATEYFQDLFPNQIYSYKQSCSKGLPPEARIVCYHGTPSIIESYTTTVTNYDGVWGPQDWPLEHWRT
tara:strand:+ start:507 stop:1187 length:681 start_codon:yes stop_codon:yes gene_type:complete